MSSAVEDQAGESTAVAPPRVSLVIPLYNSASHIDATLASVAGQTRRPDEVIVVDDASADGGGSRAARWSAMLPLRVITHETNRGPGAARRTGIAAASNDLIALVDSDDLWLPDHLEVMLATYRRHGGIVTADALWWAPGRQVSQVSGRRRKRVPAREHQRLGILEDNFVCPISLFARADYEQAGGFSDLPKMQDWDLWMRMIRQGTTVTMAPAPTALYRVHVSSLSIGRSGLSINIEALSKYLDDLEPDEQRVLRRTIRRRQARVDLYAGEGERAAGRLARAGLLWARAAARDRSLRGGLTGSRSSVTVQALANLITAGLVGRLRRARAGTAGTGLRQR